MFAVFFLAGMILSGSLAYAGLVRRELKFSKSKTLTGDAARNAGILCLGLLLILLAGLVWAIWTIATGR